MRLRNCACYDWAEGGWAEFSADLQAFADEDLLGGIDVGEELDAAGDFGGDAAAVLQDERVFVHGRDARPFADDAREVERIGGGDQAPVGGGLGVAQVAQAGDGGLDSELFAADAGDEASAADFAAQLHTAEDAGQLPPGGRGGLAREEIAEEDAVAGEEEAAPAIEQLLPVGRIDEAGEE